MTMTEEMLATIEARGLDVETVSRLGLSSVRRDGGEVTPEILRALLHYDPATGALTWRERPLSMFPDERSGKIWNTRYAGRPALTARSSAGYLKGHVLGVQLQAHRVAWAIHHGSWPSDKLDHENHARDDNRLDNLADATDATNARNQKRSAANTSGATGVSFFQRHQKWVAYIRAGGRRVHLGRFDVFADAVAARRNAEIAFGYHANHGGAA